MATFSERVRQLRLEYNLSLRQLAKVTGISHCAISAYENGRREAGLEALEALCDAFNCDIDYILGRSDIKNSAAQKFGARSLYEAYLNGNNIEEHSPSIDLQLFGRTQLDETQAKLVALYNKIADKEGFIRFTERLSALSEEQQRFVFENLLQGR